MLACEQSTQTGSGCFFVDRQEVEVTVTNENPNEVVVTKLPEQFDRHVERRILRDMHPSLRKKAQLPFGRRRSVKVEPGNSVTVALKFSETASTRELKVGGKVVQFVLVEG